ncbi:hypothetical protein BJF78_16330 [Pseudonocardia sp. CNS-139]|nr:hypothetical protein BJF78_16330 [Pseudonocardia sp. CNS-139]
MRASVVPGFEARGVVVVTVAVSVVGPVPGGAPPATGPPHVAAVVASTRVATPSASRATCICLPSPVGR